MYKRQLHWFRRQRSAWGRSPVGHDALADGFGAFVASTWDGALVASNLEKARARAAAFEERERPYPVIPVSVLVRVGSDREARSLLATVGVPASLVTPLYREQAWALVRMLYDGEDGRYRPSLYAYLRAWLEGETAYGMAKQQFQRAFDLRGEEEWKALDGAWEGYVRRTILGRDDE